MTHLADIELQPEGHDPAAAARAALPPALPALRGPAADHARLVAAVEQLPAAMAGHFHNLDIKPLQAGATAASTDCGSATTA